MAFQIIQFSQQNRKGWCCTSNHQPPPLTTCEALIKLNSTSFTFTILQAFPLCEAKYRRRFHTKNMKLPRENFIMTCGGWGVFASGLAAESCCTIYTIQRLLENSRTFDVWQDDVSWKQIDMDYFGNTDKQTSEIWHDRTIKLSR